MADETITLQQYVNAARQTFLTVALLPDQNHSLEITPEGCLFLLTWTKCFTEAFSKGKSWNGDFTLADFKTNNEEEKFPDDSGIELMIPYHLGDFIARIVAKVILDGIDITDEYDLNLAS
ncbi:Os12g0589700 [Oryza sativa Japonica Group]|uniref:Os12g0589700 protein n=1 Tax=Oryza sativa subsp. japonica TaxID=39947 RepID=A3CIZ2_ORYSJ|nr:hypothetical protein OsJ_36700 [Oryza sativa Japonica Group]BAH95764.1 Os12g0589700 [Oryza sativa Japonica Group]|eukprot:NP_001177036.1 Os12g0589700 [Oryza sativa Japonica Group]